MEFHASKSGHTNFSESTDEKKPLTAEEKKAAADRLQARIMERKAEREAKEAKEAIEKEKLRRQEGRGMAQIKQDMAEKEMRELAAERKRQKEEDRLAKQRVLDQIKQDRLNREAAAKGERPSAPVIPPTKVQPPPPRNYDEAKIQLRLLDGSTVVNNFNAKETLAAVRLFVKMNHPDHANEEFTLMTTFPRKVFTEDDMAAPLEALGLVPSSVLVVTRKNPNF